MTKSRYARGSTENAAISCIAEGAAHFWQHFSARVGRAARPPASRTAQMNPLPTPAAVEAATAPRLLQRKKLADLIKSIDPAQSLDSAVEEFMEQLAHDFLERVISSSCELAKHRGADTLEVKDVQLHLERSWDLRVPGFGIDEPRVIAPRAGSDLQKQRLASVSKAEQAQPKRKRLDK